MSFGLFFAAMAGILVITIALVLDFGCADCRAPGSENREAWENAYFEVCYTRFALGRDPSDLDLVTAPFNSSDGDYHSYSLRELCAIQPSPYQDRTVRECIGSCPNFGSTDEYEQASDQACAKWIVLLNCTRESVNHADAAYAEDPDTPARIYSLIELCALKDVPPDQCLRRCLYRHQLWYESGYCEY